ncbi:MAG: hypothetical protein DRQ51_05910 [Gammaproteobacteria bacterium]|nr:MAG: hypothetical protein DRQ51_05910 [Gammaproteobacteria bacterium]
MFNSLFFIKNSKLLLGQLLLLFVLFFSTTYVLAQQPSEQLSEPYEQFLDVLPLKNHDKQVMQISKINKRKSKKITRKRLKTKGLQCKKLKKSYDRCKVKKPKRTIKQKVA